MGCYFHNKQKFSGFFVFFLISGFLRPCAFFLPVFFTGLLRQLTACSVVKICFVVFLFPHCCLPLFHLEELFPFSAWKQAAGQQQVSLFLVVRSFGQLSFIFQTNQDVFLFVFHFVRLVCSSPPYFIPFHFYVIYLIHLPLSFNCSCLSKQ